MGLGIVAMHYTGMAAMKLPADISYRAGYVALSVVIAVLASTAALWLAFRTAALLQSLLAAVVMGLAISGMHYTAMHAAVFVADTPLPAGPEHSALAQTYLALAVAGITFIILLLALAASSFDRQFAKLSEREAQLLRRSEEQFRTLYRDTPLPLHSLGPNGRIEQVSDAWLNLLGYSREEVIGRRLTDFMTADSQANPDLLQGDVKDAECHLVKKSGEIIDVLLSARAERVEGRPTRTLSGLIDVTAHKRAEDALRQAQKMEAVGQLTGGIAHDFNNLLTIVLGNLEMAARAIKEGKPERLARLIDAARLGASRGATLTQRLLAFSRRQPLQPQLVDLSSLVGGMMELFKRSVGESVTLEANLKHGLWRTKVDPNQLESSLLNLVINSRDAMVDGGTIKIETENVSLSGSDLVGFPDVTPGRYVMVAVRDTGLGMPPQVKARAFEPFFTTKDIGQGTGLGLSMVYGFVKQSGGHVVIESEVHAGTTIRIYLPRALEQAPREQAAIGEPQKLPGGSETILLVEDDAEVRAYSRDILKSVGYRVLEAHDYSSAKAALDSHPDIEVLFTDVGLPGANGKQLADIAAQRCPDLRVLFTTGYAHGVLPGNADLLAKPFTPEALAFKMRAVIDRPAG
jgi:PAS domain S-box-containing protein